jgi:hypothetical protein
MKTFVIVLLWALLSLRCQGEPRWCAVSAKDASNALVYPPIARAARLQGIVVMRMIYAPNDKVVRTEPVFGPAMLSSSLTTQLLNWKVMTDAIGDEQCMTLVIAEFRFHDSDEPSRLQTQAPVAPGILRISVESEILIISDPGGTLSTGNAFRVFAFKVRRLARHLFHRSSKVTD